MKKNIVRHPEYNFSKIKNIVLYIFSFECQLCGFASLNNHVHHVDKNHKNNDPLNLTCLCVDCHKIAHSAAKLNLAISSDDQQNELLYLRSLLSNFDFLL